MAFENALEALRVPDSAAPGQPGFEFTTEIPSELAAYYLAPSDLVAVRLGFTTTLDMYWYEGVKRDGIVATGWVVSGAVHETSMTVWETLGGYGRLMYGNDPVRPPTISYGPGTGTSTGYVEYRGGFRLVGQPGTLLDWQGDASFRNGERLSYETGPGGSTFGIAYGCRGTLNAGPTAVNRFVTPIISFPTPFASPPEVLVNLRFGPAATNEWVMYAVNITNTGFQIMGTGPVSTWNTTLGWVAIQFAPTV